MPPLGVKKAKTFSKTIQAESYQKRPAAAPLLPRSRAAPSGAPAATPAFLALPVTPSGASSSSAGPSGLQEGAASRPSTAAATVGATTTAAIVAATLTSSTVRKHAFTNTSGVDRALDVEFGSILAAFEPGSWEFLHEKYCKPPRVRADELGMIWTEDAHDDEPRLKGVYILGLRAGSWGASEGIRLPSSILSINGECISGMLRARFHALLKDQPFSLVFGLGQPKDASNPKACLDAWTLLNANNPLPSKQRTERKGDLNAFVSDRTAGNNGRYVVCQPTVDDANQLFTLGLEFLFDHIQLGVDMDQKKEWINDTDMKRWRNSIGLWANEKDVSSRISQMRTNMMAEKYIFKCIHERMDMLNSPSELVGFVEFSIFKDKLDNNARKLFCSKLKITHRHQRRYVARYVYQSTLRYLIGHMAVVRPRVFSNLQGCVLKVFDDNNVAKQLYESLGFKLFNAVAMQNLPRLRMARMDTKIEMVDEEAEDSDGYAPAWSKPHEVALL